MQMNSTHHEQTEYFGEQLGQIIEPNTVIVLVGDLGVGKTVWTKGLAKGLGITDLLKSPTYTLIREYQSGRLPLYHMDMYRVSEDEADVLGLDDYFYGGGVTVVEWPQNIADYLPSDYLTIRIERVGSTNEERLIQVMGEGPTAIALMNQWQQAVKTEEMNDD
ncbi:tRNA (adenosine(37)-N6)-threonylcarbamoyltransferase complex ATPase subunit type 1 TsaE [Atopobacter phocae]|uniref:tRNA (adenosine(37)-N6)-threonylcarbamoyltransferase complex ATPase subunit type 1 TsaE n=1 Tax=Atopobacter phocae TaxID=136492 RepID=UPI0004B345AE|nr:tRNA (adenosine(37)-N6)-threonylcarbamoyltransferase complex ATPase subunit type 1 TsaE [Atopobacter phocae]